MMNALLDVDHKALKEPSAHMTKRSQVVSLSSVELSRVESPVEQAEAAAQDSKFKKVVAYTVLAVVAALSNWYLYDLYMGLF